MPNFPTFDDLFRIGRDEVLARNAQISRDAVEREGMDANILIASACAMGDEVVGQLSDLASALFLDSATGTDLDHLVFDRYGLTRKPAAASIGSIAFTTAIPSPTTFTIPVGAILQSADGVQFATTESTIYVAGSVGPLVVVVRSVLAGPNQNAKAGTITSIVSQISGSPSNLVVTNPYATTGAAAIETDDALRERARRFFTTARRGTIKSIEEAALGVPGITQASAFEMLDAIGRSAHLVNLVVTDTFTEQFMDYSTIPPRYQTQSQAISATVFEALSDVRPAGVFVQVVVANVIIQPVTLTLAFTAGASVNDSALQARAAVVNYINTLSPGNPIVVADMLKLLRLVPGISYTGNEVLSPAGNVVALPLQVLRTSLGLVSAVAAQGDQPIITGNNPDSFTIAGS
jgi:uncharacterized phage protein gp47/JayE